MSNHDESQAKRVVDDETFMSVKELKSYMTEVEMARASQAVSAMDKAAAAKKALIAELMKPIDLTPERRESLLSRIKAAAARGETEIMVLRFPVELCTDGGRAINNSDPDWPDSLKGRPRQVFEIWKEYLQPAGYKLKALIVEWPGGLPGEVGMFLAWS
jgi:hypothetical protein